MKSVHKALHLRHHKHSGKILHHRHTSYRVLFMLLLVPIAMMALVNHLDAVATDMLVSATVPAPMPSGSPDIESPVDGETIDASQVTVSGTCPVITPAIIVSVTDNGLAAGSVVCANDGTFSVPIPLVVGTNALVATVLTITGQYGGSSTTVTVSRPAPPQPPQQPGAPNTSGGSGSSSGSGYGSGSSASQSSSLNGIDTLDRLVHIVPTDIYVLIAANGEASWHGSFQGGTPPYDAQIDWGDGTIDKHKVSNQELQVFTHKYNVAQPYAIIISATDARGDSSTLHSAGVTLLMQQGLTQDTKVIPSSTPPILRFVEQYVWQIYIGTFGAVAFLWYLDHGWLLPWHAVRTIKIHRH